MKQAPVPVEAIYLTNKQDQDYYNETLTSLLEIDDVRDCWSDCLEEFNDLYDIIGCCSCRDIGSYKDVANRLYHAYHINIYFTRNGKPNVHHTKKLSPQQMELAGEIHTMYNECMNVAQEREEEIDDDRSSM